MNDTLETLPATAGDEPPQPLITLSHVVYACYALGFFVGITWLIGVIVAYVKREEAAGTWLASHFSWQIRTFWWGLLWGLLLIPLTFVLVLMIVTILVAWVPGLIYAAWLIYRVVRGWLLLNERRAIPA
jgi:uncharacterized membrane protein